MVDVNRKYWRGILPGSAATFRFSMDAISVCAGQAFIVDSATCFKAWPHPGH